MVDCAEFEAVVVNQGKQPSKVVGVEVADENIVDEYLVAGLEQPFVFPFGAAIIMSNSIIYYSQFPFLQCSSRYFNKNRRIK